MSRANLAKEEKTSWKHCGHNPDNAANCAMAHGCLVRLNVKKLACRSCGLTISDPASNRALSYIYHKEVA